MKKYCTECGQPTEYISSQPKFCQGCGESFDPLIRASASQAKASGSGPRKAISELNYNDDDDEGESVGSVPSIAGLEVEIEVTKPYGISLKDIIALGDNSSHFEREVPPSQSREEFLQDFKKEAGSIRKKSNNE